jgi:hypothetical protein
MTRQAPTTKPALTCPSWRLRRSYTPQTVERPAAFVDTPQPSVPAAPNGHLPLWTNWDHRKVSTCSVTVARKSRSKVTPMPAPVGTGIIPSVVSSGCSTMSLA